MRYLPFLYLKRKTDIYSPSLITAGKSLPINAKVKTIVQYYDNLAACFGNKLNFMKWKWNY